MAQGINPTQMAILRILQDPAAAQVLQQLGYTSTGSGGAVPPADPTAGGGGGADPTNGLSGGGLPSLDQALNQVAGAQQFTGQQTGGTNAIKTALQQSIQDAALAKGLNNQADANVYGIGSLTKNPELLPTLEGQENALKSKQQAALMRFKASQVNRDAGPGLHGSAGSQAPPRWLQQVSPGGELSDMPSYEQSNLLDWHAAHPEYSQGSPDDFLPGTLAAGAVSQSQPGTKPDSASWSGS